MSSRKHNGGGGSGLIFLVFLIIALGYISGGNESNQGNRTETPGTGGAPEEIAQKIIENEIETLDIETAKEPESKKESNNQTPPKLLVLKNTGASKHLIAIYNGKEEVVFTDSDEPQKILSIIGVDNKGFAYALVGDNYDSPQGKLAKISTDLSGKLTIISEDNYLVAPSVSPDGNSFLILKFDNSELNFGFDLIKKTGSSEVKIDHDAKGITYPVFSSSGKIAYIKGQAGSGEPIKLMVSVNGSSKNVFTFSEDQSVTDLVWLGENKILIALENLGNNSANKGTLKIFDLTKNKLNDFYDASGKERYLKSTIEGWIAMISGELSNSGETRGDVIIFNENDLKEKKIYRAEGVVGWLN
jgi:hypothetical protein